jgi:hypothetical protein
MIGVTARGIVGSSWSVPEQSRGRGPSQFSARSLFEGGDLAEAWRFTQNPYYAGGGVLLGADIAPGLSIGDS